MDSIEKIHSKKKAEGYFEEFITVQWIIVAQKVKNLNPGQS